MNKESLQYRRVDKCILNAFIKISPQIPFEKMTVQDILDEIGRASCRERV